MKITRYSVPASRSFNGSRLSSAWSQYTKLHSRSWSENTIWSNQITVSKIIERKKPHWKMSWDKK